MRTLTITFAANETRNLQIGGDFFELYKCSYDLARVALEFEFGSSGDTLEGVREGVYVENMKFTGFAITNGATAQTVVILLGKSSGGNRAAPLTGSVSITNTVPVSGPLTDVQLRASAVLTRPQQVQDAAGGLSYLAGFVYGTNLDADAALLVRLSMPVAATRRARVKSLAIDVPAEIAAAPNGLVSVYKVKGYTAAPAGQAQAVVSAGNAASFSQALISSQHGADSGLSVDTGYTGAVNTLTLVKSVQASGGIPSRITVDAEKLGIGLAAGEALVIWMRNTGGASNTKAAAFEIAWAEE